MNMETENDKNRVGIYTQVSAEATAAGEGLAPQGEKSPVVTNNGNPNQVEYMNMSANHSQCNENVSQSQATKSQENTDDNDNPFRKEGNLSTAGSYTGEWDGGEERLSRDNKYRIARFNTMWKEFKKLEFSNSEIKAMETALEDERKRRHNRNKMIRYCQENNLDEATAKQRMLERKERETAKYKAEKAEREAAKAKKSAMPDLRNECSGDPLLFREYDPKSRYLVFTSPALLAGANPSMKDRNQSDLMQPESSRMAVLPLNQRPGGDRNRSRSPLNRLGIDNQFGEARRRIGLSLSSDSSDLDNTEKSLSAFSITNNLAKLSKKQRKKLAKGNLRLDPLNLKYPIEVQIVNRAHPFGAIVDDDQLLLLKGLQNSLQEERDNGANWIKVGECIFKKKILHIRCRNDETVACLEQKIPFFNRLLLGADLYLAKEKVAYSYKKVKVTLNNYILTTEEFFKIIKKQNGYPTEVWQEYWRKDEFANTHILFGVDPASYERLQRDCGSVYFFMGKLLLRLDRKVK